MEEVTPKPLQSIAADTVAEKFFLIVFQDLVCRKLFSDQEKNSSRIYFGHASVVQSSLPMHQYSYVSYESQIAYHRRDRTFESNNKLGYT